MQFENIAEAILEYYVRHEKECSVKQLAEWTGLSESAVRRQIHARVSMHGWRDIEYTRAEVMVGNTFTARCRAVDAYLPGRQLMLWHILRFRAAETARQRSKEEPLAQLSYCAKCAAHYGDSIGICDQGKPVASPHRVGKPACFVCGGEWWTTGSGHCMTCSDGGTEDRATIRQRLTAQGIER